MTYNVVLVSGIQQSDSVIYIYIYTYIYICIYTYVYVYIHTFFFIFFSIVVYHRILNIVPRDIQ